MMSNEDYQDRILTCRDCGNEFIFSAGEQEFFARKGLMNPPSRCPNCRAARRGGQVSSGPASHPRSQQQYEAICASCGRSTLVPFVPREDRPVYCNECFQAQRASRSRNSYDNDYGYSHSGGRGRNSRRDSGGRRDRRDYRW